MHQRQPSTESLGSVFSQALSLLSRASSVEGDGAGEQHQQQHRQPQLQDAAGDAAANQQQRRQQLQQQQQRQVRRRRRKLSKEEAEEARYRNHRHVPFMYCIFHNESDTLLTLLLYRSLVYCT